MFRIAIVIVSLFLPACIKTYKLVPPETPQGVDKKESLKITQDFVRSARIYDQWETQAMFDVIWVSDEVRRAYVDSFCERRGQSDRDAMLKKELDANYGKMTFYVLADVRDKLHPMLNDELAAWTMHLEVGGIRVAPHKKSIKEVELSPEMQSFFGHRYRQTKFKTAYEVTFPKLDGSGKPYITPGKPFTMVIGSVSKACILGWQGGQPVAIKDMRREKKRKLIKDEDYYWV